MYIRKLTLTDFRNFTSATVEPGKGINFFYGANASGKTSVLESVNYLAQARSFRSNKSSVLINRDASEFVLFSELYKDEAAGLFKLGIARNREGEIRVNFNGSNVSRVADLAENICVQAVVPNGLSLLEAGPSLRRSFIDWGCFYHYREYAGLYGSFRQILKQRNALLAGKASADYLAYWDDSFVKISLAITGKRQSYLELFNTYANELVLRFFPGQKIFLELVSGHKPDYESFSEQLRTHYQRELKFGYSLIGPHKADLNIKINNSASLDLLSRGQQKLLIIALKLAQGLVCQSLTGCNCVFLIDDIASELDTDSLKLVYRIVDELSPNNQFFITCINRESALLESVFKTELRVFHVEQNDIKPE